MTDLEGVLTLVVGVVLGFLLRGVADSAMRRGRVTGQVIDAADVWRAGRAAKARGRK